MTSRLAGIAKHLFKMGATKTDITLYTVNTPNGIKASILLAELNLDYKVGCAGQAQQTDDVTNVLTTPVL